MSWRGSNNSNFRGRGSWSNNNRKPWSWMNKNRGGRGRGFRASGGPDSEVNSENDILPRPNEEGSCPPPPKRRKSIKTGIISTWKNKLPGYSMYYPDAPPQLPEIDKKILLITDYFHRKCYLQERKLLDIEEKEYFEVICENVLGDHNFLTEWSDFAEDLHNEPAEVVNLWGAVMHKIVTENLKSEDDFDIPDKDNAEDNGVQEKFSNVGRIGKIHAGLMKLEPVIPLIRINSSLIGKFVTIRGAIVGTGTVRAVCLQMTFLCKPCETEFIVDQPYGIYTLPKRCGVSEECDNKSYFEPCETSETTLMMDCRKIRLQDVQNQQIEVGAVPKTIDCELTNGLVYECSTGDVVTITGIVKMRKEFHFNGEQNLHNFYIEVIAMRNHIESERTMGGNWFSFSNKDYCAIGEIFEAPNLFQLLVASLCPSIYGHELVKAALLLSLFGGTSSSSKDEMLSRRSDINILMIGDPGIGKSQMLKIVTEVAPRAVFVCGTGSSVAGLTVTLVKDGDQYSLEAGALVMSDRGVCCIDEFDKMQPQHSALLEAMEQQSVSIAKSGVFRTLPARTTVIAAANPVGGHYDQRKSVIENIKINTALLSRFDITFILLDKPNKDFDQKIVEHIMGMPGGSRKRPASTSELSQGSEGSDFEIPLRERLKVCSTEPLDLIPHSLIRKYIAYARQYVKPKISPEAKSILKEYYLKLRVKHRMRDSTPITTRQLESLIRLTEARAKLELREIATSDDAKDILEIFESSLSSAFDDEVIAVSALSQSILIGTPMGSGKSQSRNQAKSLVAALQRSAEQQSKNIFTTHEIKEVIKFLKLSLKAEALIAALNNEGYLLKKGANIYQLQTVDY